MKKTKMKIQVLYFARLKETLKYSTEELDLTAHLAEKNAQTLTILQLKAYLAGRGEQWSKMLMGPLTVRAAINHELVDDAAEIHSGDEVGFFPPMTGGWVD